VRRVAAADRPDLVLAASPDVPFLGIPTVAVVRDLVGPDGRGPSTRDRLYLWRARHFAKVVVPSTASRDALKAAGLGSWRVSVIPEHVEPVERVPPPKSAVLHVLHAGRIHPAKAQHLSIDAVRRLPPEDKARVRLAIVGTPASRVYVDQLRIAARDQPVDFHTDVGDLGPFFHAAHLVLYPTIIPEGFADMVLLAMAYGRPVIWSDHPGVRATTGGLGVPIRPGDVQSLSQALRRKIDDRAALDSLGRASHDRTRAYGWSRIAPSWEAVFEVASR